MLKNTRVLFFVLILISQMFVTFADRGFGRKKSRVVLNIKTPSNFSSSLQFNLRNGMKYTGSITPTSSVSSLKSTLITYTKGNSVYILPYKQQVFVADARPGFAGTKLIIRVP